MTPEQPIASQTRVQDPNALRQAASPDVLARIDAFRALTPAENRALELQLVEIVSGAGVVSQSLFVERPGYIQVAQSVPTDAGRELLLKLNILPTAPEAAQLAEAHARQTYLNFARSAKDGSGLLKRVIEESGHRSVTKGTSFDSLFAGVSIDSAIRMIGLGGGIAR